MKSLPLSRKGEGRGISTKEERHEQEGTADQMDD